MCIQISTAYVRKMWIHDDCGRIYSFSDMTNSVINVSMHLQFGPSNQESFFANEVGAAVTWIH